MSDLDITEVSRQSGVPASTLRFSLDEIALMFAPDGRPRIDRKMLAAKSGTPYSSFFAPPEMLALARGTGFKEARHVAAASLAERYFSGRADGLRRSSGEDFLAATT